MRADVQTYGIIDPAVPLPAAAPLDHREQSGGLFLCVQKSVDAIRSRRYIRVNEHGAPKNGTHDRKGNRSALQR